MTDIPKVALGTAVLAGERLTGRTSSSSPVAIAIGLAQQGATRARHAAARVTGIRIKMPEIRSLVHDAGARGAITMSRSRREAETVLKSFMDGVMNGTVPKVIDGLLPQIRERVLPVLVDDLSRDPKIRTMITEQGQGMLTDATDELRETSADADDRLETGFRRLFRIG